MSAPAERRVGLDVTQAVKRRGRGIARYIRQVVAAMPDDGLEADLFIRGHRWFQRSLVDDLPSEFRRRWLPFTSRLGARDLDLFHGFGNHLPTRAPCPLSFTVHDVRALDEPAGYEGKERLQRNIRLADGIVCLTDYGRERLLHHAPKLEDREIAVIPHGVDHDQFRPRTDAECRAATSARGLERPYLLQLGSWFPHKNLELSVTAWAGSQARSEGHDLAFVGGGAPGDYRQRIEEIASRAGATDRVHWIEHVPETELPLLLAGATALLQPSRYEGFALPLLEAMASGVPGVVSNASCLPEVSAGIWPVAGPDDPDAFAAGIDLITLDATTRQRAIDQGLAHAATFTWARSASAHDAFYRRVIDRATA